jgi:UDP-glucuronate decarboxylase
MDTVLVTGGDGWIGKFCVKILEDRGYHVVKWKNWYNSFGLANSIMLNHQPKYLLHLAWDVTPNIFWENPKNVEWFKRSISLVTEFQKCGVKVVVAGTCAETTNTLYGRCKKSLRDILWEYSYITGLELGWGVIFYPYGPYERPEKFIPSTIISLLGDTKVTVNHPHQMIDFIHVEDVAGALVVLLESEVSGIFDIGSGDIRSLKTVSQIIGNEMGKADLIEYGDTPFPNFISANPYGIYHEVGFKPKYDLISGIKNTIEFWKNELYACNVFQ